VTPQGRRKGKYGGTTSRGEEPGASKGIQNHARSQEEGSYEGRDSVLDKKKERGARSIGEVGFQKKNHSRGGSKTGRPEKMAHSSKGVVFEGGGKRGAKRPKGNQRGV